MPPFKKPTSLRALALQSVAELTKEACLVICVRHGCFCSQRQRYEEAAMLRHYLAWYMGPLMDELCYHIFTTTDDDTIRLASDVFLSALMNRRMRSLTCRGSALLYNYFSINGTFWKKQLANVPNLRVFDLYNVDHIPGQTFQIISELCYCLEVIKFKFEATTIQGVEYLHKVKSLRIIKDTGKRNLFNVERNVFYLLLEKLPNLEYINSCKNMGEVISCNTNISKLSLVKAWESKSTLNGVNTIISTCPQLKALTLGRNINSLSPECSFVIGPLTSSPLELTSIKLVAMRFSRYVEEFLQKKGSFLRSLTLQNLCEVITLENLTLIGKCCPRLEEFKVYNTHVDNEIYQFIPYEEKSTIFNNLVKFACEGTNPLPIQVCLANATKIKTVSISCQFWNIGHGETGNLLTLELISKNALTELESLYIDFCSSEFVLSQDLIEHIFYGLPNLVKLDLLNMIYNADLNTSLQKLNGSIETRNLDIDFKYSFEE